MYAQYIEPFSILWWKMNSLMLFIGILIITIGYFLSKNQRNWLCKWMGIGFLFDLFFFQFALVYMGDWDMHWALPLQYCTLMEFCAAIALIIRGQWLYELMIFIGMIGPIQALIAPALPYEGGYFFYEFYISHSAAIFSPIFLTVFGMRPRKYAWIRVCFEFTCFAGMIFYFNSVTGSNYMFLMEKPPVKHPFLEMGEWPYYLGIWLGFLVFWSFVMNLVFWALKKVQEAFHPKEEILQ